MSGSGKYNVEYSYISSTIDPEGDQVFYLFDWGDGSIDDYGAIYASDESVEISHLWEQKGAYEIKAKAKDLYDAESEWGSLDMQLSRYKSVHPFFDIVQWIIKTYPMLAPLFA